VFLHEVIVASTVGAIVAQTGCYDWLLEATVAGSGCGDDCLV